MRAHHATSSGGAALPGPQDIPRYERDTNRDQVRRAWTRQVVEFHSTNRAADARQVPRESLRSSTPSSANIFKSPTNSPSSARAHCVGGWRRRTARWAAVGGGGGQDGRGVRRWMRSLTVQSDGLCAVYRYGAVYRYIILITRLSNAPDLCWSRAYTALPPFTRTAGGVSVTWNQLAAVTCQWRTL